jgi:hypothetical protein
MMDQTTNVGSLDELVTRHVASFIQLGVDNLHKVSLVEAAWHHPDKVGTPDEYATVTGYVPPEAAQRDLDRLVEAGLLDVARSPLGTQVYTITHDPERHEALGRLLELWADPNFRSRAVAQLHYAGT